MTAALEMLGDINATNYHQQSALHLACRGGMIDMIFFLLNKNIDATLIDHTGQLALHEFCKRDDFSIEVKGSLKQVLDMHLQLTRSERIPLLRIRF